MNIMQKVLEKIRRAKGTEIEWILQAALDRYRALFPGWEVNIVSLEKCGDKNQQLDNMILLLENMKEKNPSG